MPGPNLPGPNLPRQIFRTRGPICWGFICLGQICHRIDTGEWTPDLYAELVLHQEEVEAIRSKLQVTEERINEGAYIRTGYDWKCESEAPTGMFLKQEQWRGDQRYIGVLELEEGPNRAPTVIRTQQEVERAIVDFYDTLYRENLSSL